MGIHYSSSGVSDERDYLMEIVLSVALAAAAAFYTGVYFGLRELKSKTSVAASPDIKDNRTNSGGLDGLVKQ